MKNFLFYFLIVFSSVSFAQNVAINATGAAPVASAMLDITSTTSGLLIPRMSSVQRVAIASPATGLKVYDTTTNTFWYFNGVIWVQLLNATTGWAILGNAGTSPSTNFLGTTDPVDLVLRTNNIEKMRIMSGGNVGIGNTNPPWKLSVAVSALQDGIEASNGTNFIRLIPGNVGPGTLNALVAANDNLIAFSGPGGVNTGNLVIGPWNSSPTPLGFIKILGSSGNVGIGTSPAASAILDVNATDRGFLMPRMTTLQRTAIAAPATGLKVYDTTTNTFWWFNGVIWVEQLGTNNGWALAGNTLAGTEKLGSLNAQPVMFFSNNTERMRILATGQVAVNSTVTFANSTFYSLATGNNNAVDGNAAGTGAAVYGQNTGTGQGVYGISTSNTGFGVFARNINATGTGLIVNGNNAAASYLINGSGAAVTGFSVGVWGRTTDATSGIGAVFSGNAAGATTFGGGAGVIGTALNLGVIGNSNNASLNVLCAGGYFQTNAGGSFAYVGARTAANVNRKIEGNGTVNTTVKDLEGKQVVLSCPEAPENLFQDFGQGQLLNGKAHITIDPIFSKNIVVNDRHPLRVFVQLKGDCNGVFVINETATGFDVVELKGGNSNVSFSYFITANRADEILSDGSISPYSSERFAPAMGPQKEIPLETKAVASEIQKLSVNKDK